MLLEVQCAARRIWRENDLRAPILCVVDRAGWSAPVFTKVRERVSLSREGSFGRLKIHQELSGQEAILPAASLADEFETYEGGYGHSPFCEANGKMFDDQI